MPMRFANTYSPQTDFGRGLQALAASLFAGRDTPNERLDAEARRELWEAQSHGAVQEAGLNAAKRRLVEDQLYARAPDAIRALAQQLTGATDSDMARYTEWLRGGNKPVPVSVPAPTIPPPIGPSPSVIAQSIAGKQMQPDVRPFEAAPPIAGTELPEADVRPFPPAHNIMAAEESLQPIGQRGVIPQGPRPGATTHAEAWGMPAPTAPVPFRGPFGPFASDPRFAPGISGFGGEYPRNEPVRTPPVDVAATAPEDELMRRISAAIALGNVVRMGGDNVNMGDLGQLYLELLRNPTREDVLAGRLEPEVGGARIAATEPGKPLYESSPQGIFSLFEGDYSDVSSPAITAGAAYDRARRDAELAQADLRRAQIPREEAHARLYDAQAGYYNERDRSSSRARAGDKPKALTSIQRKALDAAWDSWRESQTSGMFQDADAVVDSAFEAQVKGHAADLIRDPGSEYFDDPQGALEAAIAEAAPEGLENSLGMMQNLPFVSGTLAPKPGGVKRGGQSASPATPQQAPPRPAGKSDAQLIEEARAAVQAGADPNQVNARLRAWGVKGQ